MTSTEATMGQQLTGERADILEALRAHRGFLRQTLQGLDDEQATRRSTVSALDLAGLVKHVAETEAGWIDFVQRGPEALGGGTDWANVDWEALAASGADPRHDEFHVVEGETVAGVLARYDEVAARTDELVATVDLDSSWPLPEAPWFPKGATRSARRVFIHIVGETAQHAGHADIIREAIDGAKTMG
jgi:hypothetical protein